jgi:hypothetical protein
MQWQPWVAGLIVALAGGYVIWRFRGKNERKRRPQGPDVPLSRLTEKRRKRDSCRH